MIQSLGLVYKPKDSPARMVLPVLGAVEDITKPARLVQIPVEEVELPPRSRVAFHTDPRGVAADRFRYLRLRLRELSKARKLNTLLIASPLPQDGKSTVAVNLATALAERGRSSVLLIEADLYHPALTQILGLKPWAGLAECLENGVPPLTAIRRIAPLGWCLLPAGKPAGSPGDLLHGETFSKVMQTLAPHFDWILLDSPPLGPLTDALELARHAEAALLVVRAGRTPREAVDAALAALGPRYVAAVILNGAPGLARRYSKYYGYYAHASSTGSHERNP